MGAIINPPGISLKWFNMSLHTQLFPAPLFAIIHILALGTIQSSLNSLIGKELPSNSTFFLHTHRTACGKLIIHAHPFNKGAEKENPSSQHKHNKIDLQVISSLHYFIDFGKITELEEYLIELCAITIPTSKGIVYHISSSIQKRGPPFEPIFI